MEPPEKHPWAGGWDKSLEVFILKGAPEATGMDDSEEFRFGIGTTKNLGWGWPSAPRFEVLPPPHQILHFVQNDIHQIHMELVLVGCS